MTLSMRRIISVLAVAALMAAMMVAMAMPAFAVNQGGGQSGERPLNFGNCASVEATTFPAGPAKGEDQSLARVYNPHARNIECPASGL